MALPICSNPPWKKVRCVLPTFLLGFCHPVWLPNIMFLQEAQKLLHFHVELVYLTPNKMYLPLLQYDKIKKCLSSRPPKKRIYHHHIYFTCIPIVVMAQSKEFAVINMFQIAVVRLRFWCSRILKRIFHLPDLRQQLHYIEAQKAQWENAPALNLLWPRNMRIKHWVWTDRYF